MPSCIALSGHLSQPRHMERVAELRTLGFDVRSAGYSRGMYEGSGLIADDDPVVIGSIRSGRYFRRVIGISGDVRRLRSELGEALVNPDLIWCFGLDMLALALLIRRRPTPSASRPSIVVELGDVRGRAQGSLAAVVDRLANQFTESVLLLRADGVVVTAPGQLDLLGLRDKGIPQLVVLNRLSADWRYERPKAPSTPRSPPFKIGVVGFFRYLDIVERMVEAGETLGSMLEIQFHGDGTPADVRFVRDLCERFDCAGFHGPFRAPDDLPSIYQALDAVCAVYDASDENVQSAIPNRFFQSAWFGRPLLVAANTYLADLAVELDAGVIRVDDTSHAGWLEVFSSLTGECLRDLAARSMAVPEDRLRADPKRLIPFLRALDLKSTMGSG